MSRIILFIALRQLWDRKLLNGIAVLGVMLGVLTLIGINGIMQGFQQKFLQNILKISPHVTLFDKQLRPSPPMMARYTQDFVVAKVNHETPTDRQLRVQRPSEIVHAIEKMEGVYAASSSLLGSVLLAFGPKQYSVELRGIEPAKQNKVTPIEQFMVDGSFRSFAAANDGIILGSGVASRIGARIGDVVLCSSPLGEKLNLKISGIFDAGIPPVNNGRVYVNLKNAQILLGKPDVVGRIEVKMNDPEDAMQFNTKLEQLFGYDGESWQETNANFLALFKQQDTIISFVVGAILSVGGFGILAIQIMIVLQKTKDIAILRSIGFKRKDILLTFLIQGAIIALLGAAIGNIGGHYVIQALSKLKTHQEGLVKSEYFLVHENPKFYIYGAAFALAVGLLASFIPAWRGSRVEPVDVLRGQIG